MSGNLVSPRRCWRRGSAMREFDALPPPLRAFAARAALPWSARSLRRLWTRALQATGCPGAALARLEAAEAAALAREAGQVWGRGYPVGAPPLRGR